MGKIKYLLLNLTAVLIAMLNGCTQAKKVPPNGADFPEKTTSSESSIQITDNSNSISNTESNTEQNYNYETQELYAKRGENQIFGLLYLPQNAGEKLSTVIFSHEFYGQDAQQAISWILEYLENRIDQTN